MTQPSAAEQYMLELINADRAAVGDQPLVFNDSLQTVTENYSQSMIASDVFSHTGADGSTVVGRMEAGGYHLSGSWAAGENIAWASLQAPDDIMGEVALIHQGLMNSPEHRANILNPAFHDIGIGIETGDFQGWNATVVTEDFGSSSAASPMGLAGVPMVPAADASPGGQDGAALQQYWAGHDPGLWF